MPTSKTRISVPISPEIASTIRIEAKKIGVSESAYCAFVIGLYLQSQSNVLKSIEKSLNLLNQSQSQLTENSE